MTDARSWRIDDLAHETGLTVDTIRYYQREGLLPPGAREGRHRIYGPEHVRRIKQIKELQGRRFSIAAIRALIASEDRLIGVFADRGEDEQLTFEELLERSAASAEIAKGLQTAGVLRDPHEFGRTAYDGDDLQLMRTMAHLEQVGVPPRALEVLAQVYVVGFDRMIREILETFEVRRGDGEADFDRVQQVAAEQPDLVPSVRRLVDYIHHRTLQRVTLENAARNAPPGPAIHPDMTDELTLPGDA